MKSSQHKTALPRRIEGALDLPMGVLSSAPRIELCGNRRVLVEGCKRVLTCDADRICLCTDVGEVRFSGRELCMNCLTPEHAVITGRLLSVEFV